MDRLHVAVVGSGGREHALAWKIAQSELVARVTCVPGNTGTAIEPKCTNLSAANVDRALIGARPDLVVVGPEAPLADGLADRLRAAGLLVVGPGASGARLEASKAHAKEIMVEAGVPTARHVTCSSIDEVADAIDSVGGQVGGACVVKADGLAGGKGVIVCSDRREALEAARQLLESDARSTLVVEERLSGPEVSAMILTDGAHCVDLPLSQDHKRLLTGDLGPNTGGMGAVTPVPFADPSLGRTLRDLVFEPVLERLRARGVIYRGFLYAGLMLTDQGPRVLEFNVRLGDPEAQALLFGLETDIFPHLMDAARGSLGERAALRGCSAAVVVLASRGYPQAPELGHEITGLDQPRPPGDKVFHAGVAWREGPVTSGGRVLGATARRATLADAVAAAYAIADGLRFEGAQVRRDIGGQALMRR